MKIAFNNVRYQDQPRFKDEAVSWSDSLPRWQDRIEVKPVKLDSDDYLYEDTNADRFNAGPDYGQRHGQPRGYDPLSGKVINKFDSEAHIDDIREQVFVDDLISTFNNEERLITDILNDIGGN